FINHFISSRHTIALVSEPYTGARDEVKSIRGLNIHQFPAKGRVKACIIAKPNLSIIGLSQYSFPNLCVVRVQTGHTHTHIASVYVEPGTDIHSTLTHTDNFLQQTSDTRCILGGDFNGWHPLWGSVRANNRGEEVIDMAHASDLYVCNEGNTPTFETVILGHARSAIIDLTFASASIHHLITGWKVDIHACPSSHHNAISYTYTYTRSRNYTARFDHTSTFRYKNTKAQESMPTRAPGSACAPPPWWSDSLEARKTEVIHTHHQLHLAKKRGEPTEGLACELQTLKAAYADDLKGASISGFRDFCQLQTRENVWSLTNRLLRDSAPRRPPATFKIGGTYTTNTHDTAKSLLDHFYPDDSPDSEPRHDDLRALAHGDFL
ncbi:jg337, partial [Pararge aegeria aegeria]